MSAKLDLKGKIFGRLTVLSETDQRSGSSVVWRCICRCGKIAYVSNNNLQSGGTKSCGCYSIETQKNTHTKHGLTNTPEYAAWKSLLARCTNPNDRGYKDYGGRGIKVCERWLKLENFIQDMGKRPSNKYSIDRIDNNGHYEPNNCKWSTQQEQCNNTRHNVYIDYKGEKLTQLEVSKREKVNRQTIISRLTKGILKRWTK